MLLAFCCLAIASCFACDYLFRTSLYRVANFWLFQTITAFLTVFFDVLARGKVWSIDPHGTIGIYVYGTPLELILFGLALLYAATITYELFERNQDSKSSI